MSIFVAPFQISVPHKNRLQKGLIYKFFLLAVLSSQKVITNWNLSISSTLLGTEISTVKVSGTKELSYCGTAIAQQGNERTADEDEILGMNVNATLQEMTPGG